MNNGINIALLPFFIFNAIDIDANLILSRAINMCRFLISLSGAGRKKNKD